MWRRKLGIMNSCCLWGWEEHHHTNVTLGVCSTLLSNVSCSHVQNRVLVASHALVHQPHVAGGASTDGLPLHQPKSLPRCSLLQHRQCLWWWWWWGSQRAGQRFTTSGSQPTHTHTPYLIVELLDILEHHGDELVASLWCSMVCIAGATRQAHEVTQQLKGGRARA